VIPLSSFIPSDIFKVIYTMWYIHTLLCNVIPSNCSIPCDIFKLFIPCDTFNKLFLYLFDTMWYLQTVLYHVIPSNCYIIMWYLQTVYIMWYLQTVVCHVIHSNCFIPCDECEKKLLVIIILLRGYNQPQFLSLSGTTITVPRYFAMWCIQTVLYHVIHSNFAMPCDTLKLLHTMWYLQIVHTMWYLQQMFFIPCDTFNLFYTMWCIQTVLYHVISLIRFISCDTFKLFIPYDTFKLFYNLWYLQTVL
jgi:hypothetical protein